METSAQRGGVGEEVTRRGSLIICTKCKGEGHNARACPVSVSAQLRVGSNTQQRGRKRVAAQQQQTTEWRRKSGHCSKCGQSTHNARTCPLNRGVGIQDVILNVGDRRTIEREIRRATIGMGVYVDETTRNQYVRLNGDRGRPIEGRPSEVVRVTQPTVVDLQGSQLQPTQP